MIWFARIRPLALAVLVAVTSFAAPPTQVVFQPTPDIFPNPDRGFFTWTDFNYLDFSNVRAQGYTLTRPYIRLDPYRTTPLPQSLLTQLDAGFQEARRVGIKVIPRFSYNFALGDPDATQTQILLHLQQLAPVLAANQDVISLVEAGFIGAWGEWHHSTNGSDSPAAESAVINALMAAVPPGRMIVIRYPADLRRLQTTGPITAAEAFTGSFRARLGSHQDCFLASNDDWGTWGLYYDWTTQTWKTGAYSIAQDKAYIAQNAAYAPVGGETCNVNPPRSDCPTALSELAYLQWSYLNQDYEPTVIQGFKNGGCFGEINRRLGYRYELTSGSFTAALAPGGNLQLNLQLINRGFAAMFNARPVFAVLRNGSQRYAFPLNVDPRYWAPGATVNLSASLALPPDIPLGTYTLALWMPDQALSLQNNPLYAVQFANLGVWDATAGDNAISQSVTVQAASVSSVVISPASVLGGSSAASNQVILNGPAPSGGAVVMLTASSPAATVPAGITVPQGATSSATFTITSTSVAASTPVTVTATYNGLSASAILTVNPAILSALTASSSSVVSGKVVNTTVTLNGPAPAGGAVVTMTSSDPSATLAATATVAQGAATVVVPVTAGYVAASTPVTISASYNGVTKTAILTVNPVAPIGPVLISHASASASGTAAAVSPAIDTTGATLLVLMAADYSRNSTTDTHTDSKGNVWTPLQNCATGTNDITAWYALNPITGANHTFRVQGSYPSLAVMAFSGVSSVQSVICKISSGSTLAPGPVTTTVPSLLMTFISHAYPTPTPTISGGFTITDFQPYGNFEGISAAYQIQPAAGTSNPSWTNNAGQNYSGFLLVVHP